MKKKISKILVVISVLMVLFSVPVMAQEVTDPNKVIKEETFNAGEEKLQNEFHSSEVWRAGYYVEYLDGVVYNLEEVVRIKQEVLTNYKELAKVNPYYYTLIPQAERDLAQSKAWVEYYKLYKTNVKADFKIRYNY